MSSWWLETNPFHKYSPEWENITIEEFENGLIIEDTAMKHIRWYLESNTDIDPNDWIVLQDIYYRMKSEYENLNQESKREKILYFLIRKKKLLHHMNLLIDSNSLLKEL